MLESCSHHVSCEDIGPSQNSPLVTRTYRENFQFDFHRWLDAITRPITDYAMVIQCGGCMITGKQLKNRLQPAIDAGIPVSNYGMTIAYLHGIFGRAMKVFQDFDDFRLNSLAPSERSSRVQNVSPSTY